MATAGPVACSPRAEDAEIGTQNSIAGSYTDDSVSSNDAEGLQNPQEWDSDDDIFSVKPGLEWWQASGSLVVVVIGVGIMALPNLPNKGGLYLTVLLLFACCGTITESGMSMWKGVMSANASAGKSADKSGIVTSYEDFGRKAFGYAGESMVVAIQSCYFLGTLASFTVLIAEACHHLDGVAHPSGEWMSSGGWMLALYPLFACLAMLPNLTAVARLVPLAVASIFALCFIIVVKSALDAQRWQDWQQPMPLSLHRAWPDTYSNVGVVAASLFGAFGVVGNVPSVLCEMREPMHFPFAFKVAMGAIAVIYMAVMCTGYYGYGTFMQPDIVKSLTSFPGNENEAFYVPFDKWTGPKAMALEVGISCLILGKLIIGFPLNLMVIVYSFQTFQSTKAYVMPKSWGNILMRLAIPALAMLIAKLVPNFNELFGLVFALFGPPLQCFCPLFFGYKIRQALGSGRSSYYRRTFHVFMLVVAAFAMVVGTCTSVSDILS